MVPVVFRAADCDHGGEEKRAEGKPCAVAVTVRVPEVHLTSQVEGKKAKTSKRKRRMARGEGLNQRCSVATHLEAIVQA